MKFYIKFYVTGTGTVCLQWAVLQGLTSVEMDYDLVADDKSWRCQKIKASIQVTGSKIWPFSLLAVDLD